MYKLNAVIRVKCVKFASKNILIYFCPRQVNVSSQNSIEIRRVLSPQPAGPLTRIFKKFHPTKQIRILV